MTTTNPPPCPFRMKRSDNTCRLHPQPGIVPNWREPWWWRSLHAIARRLNRFLLEH